MKALITLFVLSMSATAATAGFAGFHLAVMTRAPEIKVVTNTIERIQERTCPAVGIDTGEDSHLAPSASAGVEAGLNALDFWSTLEFDENGEIK